MKMRRKDREVVDVKKMLEIVDACDCCRLGLVDEEGAYIVPLNFGYENQNGELILYFHSAGEGKKIELVKQQQRVFFEMDTKHGLMEGEAACAYSYLFQSVMGKGKIELLKDYQEKCYGLERVMAHYSDKTDWEFPEKMVNGMAVMKLTVTEWSCKEHT